MHQSQNLSFTHDWSCDFKFVLCNDLRDAQELMNFVFKEPGRKGIPCSRFMESYLKSA